MSCRFDIAVIGAGMAGASIAAELAPFAQIVLLEAEDRPGYHATGRSAAFWTESYGGPLVQPLTTASGKFLAEGGFLRSRGALTIAQAGQQHLIDRFLADFAQSTVRMELLDRSALENLVPDLKPGWNYGVREADCKDIDVAALHAHYLALAKRAGAHQRCRFRLASAQKTAGRWQLKSDRGEIVEADVLVNASGAWADPVAQMAGVQPLGIRPYRRTIVQLQAGSTIADSLPLVIDIGGKFYFKPENGSLWLSPHDETPSPPCDAAPEEMDVALAVDRLQGVVDWPVSKVEHKWAGLRSFAPDHLPVYGFEQADNGFFWFAGQGGFGIQTAPAAARLARQQLLGQPADAMTARLEPPLYHPARFGR